MEKNDELTNEILNEMGPTKYQIVGIPNRKEELIEYIQKEIRELDIEISKGNFRLNNLDTNWLKRNLLKVLDQVKDEEKFDMAYSTICFYKAERLRNDRSLKRKTEELSHEELAELDAEYQEKLDMLQVLQSPEKRKAYNEELRQEFSKRLNEKLDKIKRGKLKRDKLLRKLTSRETVQEELGEDFNPNCSKYRMTEKDLRKENPQNPSIEWGCVLYPKRRLLLKTKTDNKTYPELNQDVEVYSYGSFEYQFFKDNGIPIFENRTCEIIGINKKDIEGNEEEYFVIAQTKELGHQDKMTVGEIIEAKRNGRNILVLQSQEEARREARQKKRKEDVIARMNPLERTLSRMKDRLFQEDEVEETVDLDEIKNVFVLEPKNLKLSEEEKEELGRIYFSDYMVENAISNNSGYIGSLKPKENPFIHGGVRACSYAMQRPGRLIDKVYSFNGDKTKTVRNLNEVLDIIKVRNKVKSEKSSSKSNTKRRESKIIQFPGELE